MVLLACFPVAGEVALSGKVEHCIGVEFDAPVSGGHDGKLDGVTYFRGRPGYCLIVPRSADRLVPFTAQRKAAAVIAAAARGAAVRMRLRAESLAAFIKTLEEYKETCMNKAMSEMAGAYTGRVLERARWQPRARSAALAILLPLSPLPPRFLRSLYPCSQAAVRSRVPQRTPSGAEAHRTRGQSVRRNASERRIHCSGRLQGAARAVGGPVHAGRPA